MQPGPDPREGLNIFYLGMNNTYEPFDDEKVRQAIAMGIDKQRIVDYFYSEGSSVADYFTPCSVPFACGGDAVLRPSTRRVRRRCWPRGWRSWASRPSEVPISLRVVDRAYLPFPEQVAVDLQDQLQANLGITATIDVQESGTFIDNSDAGNCPASTCWAGMPTTRTPPTSWTTTSAPAPAPVRHGLRRYRRGARDRWLFADLPSARRPTPRPTTFSPQHVPDGAHRSRRFVHGMARRCRGRALVATRQRGVRRGRAWRR